MRTTLDIDEDILAFARAKAEQDRASMGQIISELARKAIQASASQGQPVEFRNGIQLLPAREKPAVITMELVNRLRDDEE
ncbi:MAG: hypothetical protein ACRCSO_00305 [Sphingomonas sp.]